MSGKLYMVPTPVGNLADMSPRAVEILRTVDLILAEDTRTSAVVMRHFNISTPMTSYHKFNEHNFLLPLVEKLESGENLAVVTDAGTPGISDPGFLLSRECRRRGLDVETLPGPTAFVPALINSGLPCDRFCFEGFLPTKKGRTSRLQEISSELRTTIIYESPLRLLKTLEDLAEVCGLQREASVSREISKIHDNTERGTLSDLISHFSVNPPRGEIVIVLGGNTEGKIPKVHRNKFKDTENNTHF